MKIRNIFFCKRIESNYCLFINQRQFYCLPTKWIVIILQYNYYLTSRYWWMIVQPMIFFPSDRHFCHNFKFNSIQFFLFITQCTCNSNLFIVKLKTFSHKTVSGMYKFVYGKLSHLFVKLTHSTVDHNLSNE